VNAKFQAILDSIPPKKPTRSKLEPYAELINELRKRGRSYREIAQILRDRCELSVGVHTLYNFVRVRRLGADASLPHTPGSLEEGRNAPPAQQPEQPFAAGILSVNRTPNARPYEKDLAKHGRV